MKTDRKLLKSSKTPFFASFALTCALAAGNAGAGIPVTDVGNGAAHWTNSISTYVSKIQAYAEYGTEKMRELDRITNLGTQVGSLTYALQGMTMTALTQRDPNYGMERCASPSDGLSLAGLFDMVGLGASDSPAKKQRTICMYVTRLENEKFNENVRILDVVKQRTTEIKRLESQIGSSDTSGKVDTNIAQATAITGQLLADIQYSNAIVKVYEGQITSLNQDNKNVAQDAFQGKKKGLAASIISTVAQTATMCLGLVAVKSPGSDFSCGL